MANYTTLQQNIMVTPDDHFAPLLTAAIRAVVSHHFPGCGARRLNREALVRLLVSKMIEEELRLLARGNRRQVATTAEEVATLRSFVNRSLEERYESSLLQKYYTCVERVTDLRLSVLIQVNTSDAPAPIEDSTMADRTDNVSRSIDWPQPIPQEHLDAALKDYRAGTEIAVGTTCAVCARRSFSKDILFVNKPVLCKRVNIATLNLHLLLIRDPHIIEHHAHHFTFGHSGLDGCALDRSGVHVDGSSAEIDICKECQTCLTASTPRLPPLSLANDNIRGVLPEHLQDCTWLEERLCAKYLASAYVIRLYDMTSPGAPEHRPRVMKGHACSFPLNTLSTAVKLPWTLEDSSALISCIVIGPRSPRIDDLRRIFRVRKKKVLDLLEYLRDNFQDYPQFKLDRPALDQLPDDDVPELLMRHVVHEQSGNVPTLFEHETSGLEQHPALSTAAEEDDGLERTFLEHHGLLDVNGVNIPAHTRSAAALANATATLHPDLILRHGSSFIHDYNNPGLFPGMYPTLFPWGIGGFESKRRTNLSFARQASHLLDLADPCFRRHWSYIFVVANMKQRRQIHLGTRLACKASDFERVSNTLASVDLELVRSVATHLSNGGSLSSLPPDKAKIWTLVNRCQLVSSKVPGSKAAMNRARADIRGYIGEFGIFQLFLTLNPSPLHDPTFQVFFGDESIDLGLRAPPMPSSTNRAARLADDPVAASDHFHFHIAAVFKYLFGWDSREGKSSDEGGILGRLSGFFLVKEHTMRGQLHGHALLWLEGGVNPRELRERFKTDQAYKERYLTFFDNLIHHHLPSKPCDNVDQSSRKPRQERPANPDEPEYRKEFTRDHILLGEEVQRHTCKITCYKGGRSSCRFLFPHEVNSEPHFDLESNSINLRVQDPTINWHNPTLLVATRHNHDLKLVLSGQSGVAAASYITSYATKSEETPANQISMIQTVFERMAKYGMDTTISRDLLSRCVMQFGRERQIHAQQAATYVRDLSDTWSSHTTIPMLSGRLLLSVSAMYGPFRKRDIGAIQPDDSVGTSAQLPSPAGPEPGSSHISGSPDIGEDDGVEDEEDHGTLPLSIGGSAHQIDDYIHRGPSLDHLCFYDFVRHCRLVKSNRKRKDNWHVLRPSHPNSDDRCHQYEPGRSNGIPRAIYSTLPRPDGNTGLGDAYCAAMLAHFRPFSIDTPLKTANQTYEEAFAATQFSKRALTVMNNWAALSECEDARDAERLLRRKQEANRDYKTDTAASLIAAQMDTAVDSATADVDLEDLVRKSKKTSAATLNLMATLASSGWFDDSTVTSTQPAAATTEGGSLSRTSSTVLQGAIGTPPFTTSQRKLWKQQMDALDSECRASMEAPRATSGALADSIGFATATTSAPDTTTDEAFNTTAIPALSTQAPTAIDVPPAVLIQRLVQERNLTPSQKLAFVIAARHFFQEMSGHQCDPLRLFMHGEAGTGKTVVVNLLRELLERYGKGKQILFMAPTGKAACAIGGSTQHSTFAIDIHKRELGSDDINRGSSKEHTAKRGQYLQNTFQHVRWLFFDEISMTSCEVLAEIDQALRIGRQKLEEPYGGMNVLFAGDLCQLPPVCAAALYSKSSLASRNNEVRTKVELGRIAWHYINEVVNFTEQMRMKDPDMAAALSRLRLRRCVQADADLFNERILRSAQTPSGVTLGDREEAIVLARTNDAVRTLNHQKATATAKWTQKQLVICSANDQTNTTMTTERRKALLHYNGGNKKKTGLGLLPLYVGMPIVYRGPNQSVALGITNGAFATVEGWDVYTDPFNQTLARGVLLRFPNDTRLQLSNVPIGCFPVTPALTTFEMATSDPKAPVEKVQRRQLPLQPGFAMTVHSAQGITASGPVIVDLTGGGCETYVAATRATRKEHLLLTAKVDLKHLNYPNLPINLKKELQRLNLLAENTRTRHDHDRWELGASPSTHRRQHEDEAGPSSKRRRLEGEPLEGDVTSAS
ncbi:hypothetical protein CF319_g4469 [Tilletia indica]|nr:hypothetical protein CF319_g4469 [Tilletia indica]